MEQVDVRNRQASECCRFTFTLLLLIFTYVWITIQNTPEVAYFNAASFKETLEEPFHEISKKEHALDLLSETLPNLFYEIPEDGKVFKLPGSENCKANVTASYDNDLCTLQNHIHTQILVGKACLIQYRALAEPCPRSIYDSK